jgi:hypothetical protein
MLQICGGVDVSLLANAGPGDSAPSRLMKTPSEVPFRNSAEFATVQNIGPDADADSAASTATSRTTNERRSWDIALTNPAQ